MKTRLGFVLLLPLLVYAGDKPKSTATETATVMQQSQQVIGGVSYVLSGRSETWFFHSIVLETKGGKLVIAHKTTSPVAYNVGDKVEIVQEGKIVYVKLDGLNEKLRRRPWAKYGVLDNQPK